MPYLSEKSYKSHCNYRIVAIDEAWKYFKHLKSNPSFAIAKDIETAESVGVSEETFNDLTSTYITQIQYATDKYNAVIFPKLEGAYKEIACEIETLPNTVLSFNGWNFDFPIMRKNGVEANETKSHDLMWMFKHYQPKLPRGLQPVACLAGFPFAWKHLFGQNMELYGGADVCSLHFILEWLPPLMKRLGIYSGYLEYVYKFRTKMLFPAQQAGIHVNDNTRLEVKETLVKMRNELDKGLQEAVPFELRNYTPKKKFQVRDTNTGKEFDVYQYGYVRGPKKIIEMARTQYDKGCAILESKGKRAKPFDTFLYQQFNLVYRRIRNFNDESGEFEEQDRWLKVAPFKASFDQLSRYINWKRGEVFKEAEKVKEEYNKTPLPELKKKYKELKELAEEWQVPKNHEGKETTAKGEIEQLSEKVGADPVLDNVLEIRSLGTNINNYIPNWEPDKRTGAVHTTFGFSAASGQIDSRKPNALNVSKHTEYGQVFRKIIEAPEGFEWIECVVPGTRLLTWNLSWKPIENLEIGQELVGFDETPGNNICRPFRALRKSVILDKKIAKKQCLKITTDCGVITCSKDHTFCSRGYKSHTEGIRYGWKKAIDFKLGQTISYFTEPWEDLNTWESGYIAGFVDGDGWVSNLSVGYAQNDGEYIDKVDAIIESYGFKLAYSENGFTNIHSPDYTCTKRNIRHNEAFGGLRFVGMFKPKRLLHNLQKNIPGSAHWGKNSKKATIISIEDVGEQDVVFLQTSTHTYIAEGFLSHNCDKKSFHVATMGYVANDPSYIRFSQLDPHSIFASYIVPKGWCKPIEMSWGDGEILEQCKWLKKKCKQEKAEGRVDIRQNQAKPVVLGNQLGLGWRKLYWLNRRYIESPQQARGYQERLAELFPKVEQAKKYIIELAARQTYLKNDFGYIQWFFEVIQWHWNKKADGGRGKWEQRLTDEARDAVAFAVQSPAFGMIKDEGMRIEPRLQNLTGLRWTGPGLTGRDIPFPHFRLSIHDSLCFLYPIKLREKVVEIISEEMLKPCPKLVNEATGPEGLKVGMEYSIGRNWKTYDEVNNPEGMREIG